MPSRSTIETLEPIVEDNELAVQRSESFEQVNLDTRLADHEFVLAVPSPEPVDEDSSLMEIEPICETGDEVIVETSDGSLVDIPNQLSAKVTPITSKRQLPNQLNRGIPKPHMKI